MVLWKSLPLSDLTAFDTDTKRLLAGSAIVEGRQPKPATLRALSSGAEMADVDMTEGVYEMIESIVHRRRFGICVNHC